MTTVVQTLSEGYTGHMRETVSIEVVRTDEKVTVGGHFGSRAFTASIVLVGDERFAQGRSGTLYRECWKCRNFTGVLPEYAGIYNGECFGCNGRGYSATVESEAKAVSLARRRVTDRARRDRKAAEREAAKVSERDAWAAANPEVAAALAEVLGEQPLVAWEGHHQHVEWEAKWGGFVTSLAQQSTYKALSEAQTAAAMDAITEARVAADAAAETASKQRYLDVAKDTKVVVSGTVAVSTDVEHLSFNGYSMTSSRLVIVEGTGEFEGVTFKMFGTGATLYAAERGDTVEVAATVKDFAEYDGVPQTVLTRAKVKVLTEAAS